MDPIFSAFGVPATVTRPAPDDTPIETTVIWISPAMIDGPAGFDLQRADRRRLLALRRDEVPTAPRGTLIDAPERDGDETLKWRVDSMDSVDADQIKVIVVPAPEF